MAQPVARNGPNTVNRVKVLIVFVPGVMGTRLRLLGGGLNWDPNAPSDFAGNWGFSTLKTKREALSWRAGPDVVMDAREGQGFKSVASGFYGDFLKALSGHKFASAETPVYAVGYDWRQSNIVSAVMVRLRIRELLKQEEAQRVVVISHSMGGLVSRAMFLQHQDAEFGSLVAGAIHVVQPAVGAVALYRRLFTGMTTEFDGSGPKDRVLNHALGTSPDEFASLISVLPGPMQLLPSQFYTRGDGWIRVRAPGFDGVLDHDKIFNYYLGDSPPGIYNEQLHHSEETRAGLIDTLTKALVFHFWIKDRKLEGKTWAIYSTGLTTDVGINLSVGPNGTTNVRPVREPEGDATVPENSGRALFPDEAHAITDENLADPDKHQFRVEGVDHAGAFDSDLIRKGVFGLVQQAVNRAVAELQAGKSAAAGG